MLTYWSEHDFVTPDRRPHIGSIEKCDNQMYVVTGYSKWGLTVVATGVQLITDLLTPKKNQFKKQFDTQRKISDEKEEESGDQEKSKTNVHQESAQLNKEEAKILKSLANQRVCIKMLTARFTMWILRVRTSVVK